MKLKSNICQACGYKSTAFNKLIEAKNGKIIHQSHTTDLNSSYYGKAK